MMKGIHWRYIPGCYAIYIEGDLQEEHEQRAFHNGRGVTDATRSLSSSIVKHSVGVGYSN